MADLIFIDHVRIRMAERHLPEAAVYHVVEDADEIIEREDGRTEYIGTWEGLTLMVVVEDDGETVVSVWDRKQRRPRRR
jgi:hypothetical protein